MSKFTTKNLSERKHFDYSVIIMKNCRAMVSSAWLRFRKYVTWSPRLEFPAWRWARNFEWVSRTKKEGRAVTLQNKDTQRLYEKLGVDTERTQIKFKPNKYKSSKYTILTFPFLNLFEQFRRIHNLYFLIVLILTVLVDSPISPMSSLLSLLVVVLITAAKQAYEDFLRHRDDARANSRPVEVIRNGVNVMTTSKELMVGDILCLTEDQEVPCDCIVLSTTNDQGQCYVMTANLDGETSHKTRLSANITKEVKSLANVAGLKGCLECENPNPRLDSFLGRLTLWTGRDTDESVACGLSNDNLLLAGTLVKNTRIVYACCVYAGTETKISLNSKLTKNKFSIIEKSLNIYLGVLVLIMIVLMIVSTIVHFQINNNFIYSIGLDIVLKCYTYSVALERTTYSDFCDSSSTQREWYVSEHVDLNFLSIMEVFLLWMTIYYFLIPLSMYVTLEMQKFLASKLFSWDKYLYDSEEDQPAQCHTSDINEELGVVTHLFSDKTGTLTRNEMVLKMYSMDGVVCHVDESPFSEWNRFMLVMTVCHSVQVMNGTFVASSPDEKAILEVCKENEFVFKDAAMDGKITVMAQGNQYEFQKLKELPFDSFRKCMSMIVKDRSGTIHVLCKGAESTMLEACSSGPKEETAIHIDNFANMGLRTLVLGYKTITEEQYKMFIQQLDFAEQSIVNRNKFVREVYKEMEHGFELLGATAIEDRLQDEVVETIHDLKRAGIKIWMLTGDKKETAINLAYSSGLLKGHFKLIDLCDNTDARDVSLIVNEILKEVSSGERRCLVLDGKSVSSLMKAKETKKQLQKLSLNCETVVACRLSPIQKSQLVRNIKTAGSQYRTAAIGDGGNDVSMLQEAHIGLAIIGHEGTAAANASDFAFSKFKYLRRAFLVHGHWYYVRVSMLIQYSFYKNITAFILQFFFAFYSDWSSMSLYESIFLFLFNNAFTLVPILIFGLTEQNLSAKQLLNDPTLYKRNAGNSRMSSKQMLKWISLGVWHSSVSFYGWYWLWPSFSSLPGISISDLSSFQAVISQTIVVIVNIKLLLEARFWSWPFLLSLFVSVLLFPTVTCLYHVINPNGAFHFVLDSMGDGRDIYQVYPILLGQFLMWTGSLLIVVVALLPEITIMAVEAAKIRRRVFHALRRESTIILNGIAKTYSLGRGKILEKKGSMKSF